MPVNEKEKIQNELIYKIVIAQEKVMGPVAYAVANSVGISFSSKNDLVIASDPKLVLGKLIDAYNFFFGRASMEITHQVAYKLGIGKSFLPKALL